MSEINIQTSSEKSFGIVFSSIFLIIALYPLFNSSNYHIWALIVSVVFLLLAYLAPKILILPNKLWFKFGILLSSIISPVFLSLLYIFLVLPTGIIMRLLRKNLLNLKFDKTKKSYWIERKEPLGSMRNQF